MRLHKIEIENITSLKGHHLINFDKILEHHNLFAITGATGSGKSSILSCIGLALYGQSNKNINQAEYISVGEISGSIRLTFSIGANLYHAIFEAKVKKDDGTDLKTPRLNRFFTNEKGEMIELELPLTFDQFSRTVVLHQGDFAKYLNSTFTKRREILEEILKRPEIDFIQQRTKDKIKSFEIKRDELIAKLSGLNKGIDQNDALIEKDTTENIKQKIHKLETERQSKETFLKELEAGIQTFSNFIHSNKKNLEYKNKEIEVLSKNAKINEIIKNKRDVFESKRNEYQKAEKNYNEQETELLSLIKTKEGIKEKSNQVINLNLKNTNIQNELTQNLSKINSTKEEIKLIQQKIQGLQLKINDNPFIKIEHLIHRQTELEEFNNIYTTYQNLSISQSEKTKQLNSIKSSEQDLEQKIKSTQFEIDNYKKEINHEKFKDPHSLFIKLNQTAKSIFDQNAKIKELNLKFNHLCEQVDLKEKEELILKKYKLQLDDELTHLNNLKLLDEKNIQLNQFIKESIHQNECLICHSKIKKPIQVLEISNMDTTTKLDSLQKKIQGNVLALQEIDKQKEVLKETCHNILQDIKQLEEKNLYELKEHGLTMAHEIDQQISIVLDLNQKKNQFQSKIIELSERKDQFTQNHNQLNKELLNLTTSIEEITESIKQLQIKADPLETIFNIKINDTDFVKKLGQLKIQIQIYNEIENEKSVNKNKIELLDHIEAEQKNKNQDLLKNNVLIANLNKEISDYQQLIKNKLNNIDPEVAYSTLRGHLNSTKTHMDQANKEYNELNLELKKEEQNLKNIAEQISDNERLIIIDKQKTSVLLQNLNITDRPIENADTNILDLLFSSCRERLLHEKENLNQISKNLGGLQQKLETLVKIQTEITSTQTQLDKLQSELKNLTILQNAIGTNLFKNFILNFIEEEIIKESNLELINMYEGRYQIVSKNEKGQNELYIYDQYLSGTLRKISAISGGETFIVSLALALGLSKLSQGHNKNELFFIDEGFGSLDLETLNDVIEVLFNLASSGKTVGIITHIKELSARIPININLNKSAQGHSTISTRYN